MHNHTPTAAILVIGNEILSGRTQDTNVSFMAKHLKTRGIKLCEVRVVPDDENDIIDAVNALRFNYAYVFTTGGIGATHDDITAATMSKAFDQPYVCNNEALRQLEEYYEDRINDNRRRMAYMPKSAQLIETTVGAAGFSVDNVYCLAGMPKVMQDMFLRLLPRLEGGNPFHSKSVTCDLLEGDIASALGDIQTAFLDVEIGSYPHYRTHLDHGVTFVISGQNEVSIENAHQAVLCMIQDFKGNLKDE